MLALVREPGNHKGCTYQRIILLDVLSTSHIKYGIESWRLMRQGSRNNRYVHSNPASRIHLGARGAIPASVSNVPPTPIAMEMFCKRAALRAIHNSCFGGPYATNKICARDALMRSTISASS